MTPPSITGPAQYITDAGGSLWSFDANGTIYRNGRKVSTNNVVGVSKVIIVGSAVFAFTSGAKQWWQWSGTGFTGPITDGDPNILK